MALLVAEEERRGNVSFHLSEKSRNLIYMTANL